MPKKPKPPAVRIARPAGRPFQLRYSEPDSGKEIRISTGTRDEAAAADQKKELEAKLLLGVDAKPRRRGKGGPSMLWEDFRERYTQRHLATLKSGDDAESRLDLCERILKPRTLGDVANSDALHDLQQKLLAGAEPRKAQGEAAADRKAPALRPRSPHTVKTNIVVVVGALRWAELMGWLPAVPRVRYVKTTKLRHMKGRPLTTKEFELMLAKTAEVVGESAAESWKHALRGLWESGLRLGELLHVHWSDGRYIVPAWPTGALPVLRIPAARQKNATEEAIPLPPGFERLLFETPAAERSGWIFTPLSLQAKSGRRPRHGRPSAEWAGKVISRIGAKAGIVVQAGDGGRPPKYASAHDLRRSFADRLVAAGVPEREVAAVMRHASADTTRRHYAPGNVQRAAGVIRDHLANSSGVPRYRPPGRNDVSPSTPGRTRTCDRRIRNPLLYPAELRARAVNRTTLPPHAPPAL
jgi:integrase